MGLPSFAGQSRNPYRMGDIMQRGNYKRPSLYKLINRDKYLILLVLPCILFFLIFHYAPMIWNIIAFQKYSIRGGIFGSTWVGMANFQRFFRNPNAVRVIRNTFALSGLDLVWGFPVPILFALLLNEIKHDAFRRIIQTFSYLPHFISTVILVGIMRIFLAPNTGLINTVLRALGYDQVSFFTDPGMFRSLYVISSIWQNFGWDSIIYFAAISSVNPELYEAAIVDGANRKAKLLHITLPSILPTIITLLILRIGWLMSVGFEKVILMYNPAVYETADVISTYVYRNGLLEADYSYGTAIGLFNSAVSLVLLVSANQISKRLSETSLF